MKVTKEEIEEYQNHRRGMYGQVIKCNDGTFVEWISGVPWEVGITDDYRNEPIYKYAENYTLEIKG